MSNLNLKDYWETRLKADFDLSGVGHRRLGKRYNEWLYRLRKQVFTRRMRHLPVNLPAASVLDVGSGTGFYIERWKDLGVRSLTGLDLTQIAVENLSRQFPDVRFLQVDIGDPLSALEPSQFDVISAFDVLFHIVDDDRFAVALRNLHSLLKAGGFLVFSDNFLHGETQRAAHQVSRSLSQIERILADTGFEIVERRPMFVLMATPVDSRSPILKMFWKALTVLVSSSELLGWLIGALLYPVEWVCVSLLAESPTTEMMICRKSAGAGQG